MRYRVLILRAPLSLRNIPVFRRKKKTHMYKSYNSLYIQSRITNEEYLRRNFRKTDTTIWGRVPLRHLRDSIHQVDINCYKFGINKLNLTLNTKKLVPFIRYILYY